MMINSDSRARFVLTLLIDSFSRTFLDADAKIINFTFELMCIHFCRFDS